MSSTACVCVFSRLPTVAAMALEIAKVIFGQPGLVVGIPRRSTPTNSRGATATW